MDRSQRITLEAWPPDRRRSGTGRPRLETSKHRELKVVPLHLPKGWRGPETPWEQNRGFRLRVASEGVLVLILGAPRASEPRPADAVLSHAPQPGEEALVVVPAPGGPEPDLVQEALALPAREGWRPAAVLFLSDPRQIPGNLGPLRRNLAKRARQARVPAAWILQEMPPGLFRSQAYFTVEQSLRELARTGRRLARWARWRNLLPW